MFDTAQIKVLQPEQMYVQSFCPSPDHEPRTVSDAQSNAKREKFGQLVAESKRRKFRIRKNDEREPGENGHVGQNQHETIQL